MGKEFIAVVYRRRECPKCGPVGGEHEPGIYERMDCGCVWTAEVGRYDCLGTARLVAARHAKLKGTRAGGRNTGLWNVETEADGVVAAN